MSKKPDVVSPARRRSALWPVLAGLLLLVVAGVWFALDRGPAPLPVTTPHAAPVADAKPVRPAPHLVDEKQCQGCHSQQVEHWKGSHHQLAMQVADDASVLGNFADVTFKSDRETTRFFKRDGGFWVNTPGSDGKPKDFPVAYAFGIEPLQQYLIDTGAGHLQALGVAWDTRQNKWFHLYPGQGVDFRNPLHWSKPQQNANFMCVECHTTGFKRNFSAVANSFSSQWQSLGVGCQACHGPASGHLEWATNKTTLDHAGFQQSLLGGNNLKEVETCARCHARRAPLGDGFVDTHRLMDDFLPSRLTRELYELDGTIKDEVFEYGSFTQSKMFAKGVRCSNCHEPHSTRLRAEGNGVCLQCHNPAGKTSVAGVDGRGLKARDYQSPEHYQQVPGLSGSQCVDCHMPGKFYMVNDWRHDHGFSIPPQARALLGDSPTQRYAQSLDALRSGKPGAAAALFEQLQRNDLPAIRRATLLAELPNYPSQRALELASRDLRNDGPQVRLAAVEALAALLPAEQRVQPLAPLLKDPIRAVRTETAYALLPARQAVSGADFDKALGEYEQVQLSLLERAEANLNLAMLYRATGRLDQVEPSLRAALVRDEGFDPARVALVQWLDGRGQQAQARQLLDDGLARHPESALLQHAKGLALVRAGQRDEALKALRKAAELEPGNTGFGYVLAVALHDQGQRGAAMAQLSKSLEQQPYNRDVRLALMHYLQQAGEVDKANGLVEALRAINPEDPMLQPRS
ncbi:tetratricopeptide repeat protein [Pseudomonas putida CSV86]|uniref:Tetratricopeptide repeat protein n=1 Tax=Pseudomonas bharatica CSV86 TaxID=1005395 RepID=L1LVX6_9PSED|nr:tetratricopeptide repeat protein [Pseudomonas bharatica]NNJ17213.1 tetratricopeptide repeat protein [Pseudomonas bharatica CSV86]